MMIPAVIEKLGYIVGTFVLYAHGRIDSAALATVGPDSVLWILFIIAFAKTPSFGAVES